MMGSRVRAVLSLAAAAVAGCANPTDPSVDRGRELAANRAKWAASGLQQYAFELRRFGAWMLTMNVRIVVTGTTIDSIIDLATGQPVPAPIPSSYQVTVEDLFEAIEYRIPHGPETFLVTYDPVSGLPTSAWFDQARIMDDEEGFNARLVRPAGQSR